MVPIQDLVVPDLAVLIQLLCVVPPNIGEGANIGECRGVELVSRSSRARVVEHPNVEH